MIGMHSDWVDFWEGSTEGWNAENRNGFGFEHESQRDIYGTKRAERARDIFEAGYRAGLSFAKFKATTLIKQIDAE